MEPRAGGALGEAGEVELGKPKKGPGNRAASLKLPILFLNVVS